MSAILAKYLNDINGRLKDINRGLAYNKRIETWQDVQQVVKLGLAPDIYPVGTQFEVADGYGTHIYDVVAHDYYSTYDNRGNALPHCMTLMCHTVLDQIGVFAQSQCLIRNENALEANVLYWSEIIDVDGTKRKIAFTPVSSVPENTYILSDGATLVDSENLTCYSTFEVHQSSPFLMITINKSPDPSSLTSANEVEHYVNNYTNYNGGSTTYRDSRIRGILNSSESNFENTTSRFYIDSLEPIAGYLKGFDTELLNVIANTYINIISGNDKIFMPSYNELFNNDKALPYFRDSSNADRVKQGTTGDNGVPYWLRDSSSTTMFRTVNAKGAFEWKNSGYAGAGAVPMFNVG